MVTILLLVHQSFTCLNGKNNFKLLLFHELFLNYDLYDAVGSGGPYVSQGCKGGIHQGTRITLLLIP